MERKVISFSLYGDKAIYNQGALRNLELHKQVYPEWTLRFYVSQEIPEDILNELENGGAEVIKKIRQDEMDGMFWRFLPAGESDVEAVIVRDIDSRIGMREKAAVDAWLASGKSFHIMRDHPAHVTLIPGGMWGCRGGVLPDIQSLLAQWQRYDMKGMDQKFLAKEVYPRIKDDCLIHSDLVSLEGEKTVPFPTKRVDGEFVGDICEPDSNFASEAARKESLALFEQAQHLTYPMPKHRPQYRFRLNRFWNKLPKLFKRAG